MYLFENSYICNAIIFHGNHQQNFKINLQSGRNPHFMNVDYRNLPVRRLFLSKDKLATVCIYKITSPTGRIYIGQSRNYENRIIAYKKLRCLKQRRLYHSLKKHGVENHIFEIIHLCKEEELNYWENYYIKLFDTFNTNNGLNLKEGGLNEKISEESKKRISESKKNKNFISYNDCKKWIKSNKLTKNTKSQYEWKKLKSNLPLFIPKDPQGYYTRCNTWNGWGDFLGTGNTHKGNFLSYDESKKWIKENILTKNIKSETYWRKIKNKLPSFIPKCPESHYFGIGWKNWGDFLGTDRISNGDKKYFDYEEAKECVQSYSLTKNIKSSKQWYNYDKNNLPSLIPKDPPSYFKNKGWKGWGDFLGTGNKKGIFKRLKKQYKDYEEAKKWVRENELTKNIKSQTQWHKITKHLPSFIPKDPQGAYIRRNSWKGWGDFLNTGRKSKGIFLSYEEAKKFVRNNPLTKEIKSQTQWYSITNKLPSFVPKDPPSHFKYKGWNGWGDFITGNRVQINNKLKKTKT